MFSIVIVPTPPKTACRCQIGSLACRGKRLHSGRRDLRVKAVHSEVDSARCPRPVLPQPPRPISRTHRDRLHPSAGQNNAIYHNDNAPSQCPTHARLLPKVPRFHNVFLPQRTLSYPRSPLGVGPSMFMQRAYAYNLRPVVGSSEHRLCVESVRRD